MNIINGKRRYLREQVHLPLMVWWEDQGRRSLPCWTLDASPAGLLLELPEITNLTPGKTINLTVKLDQHNHFDIGSVTIVRSEEREGKQLLGIKLKNENNLLFCPSMLGASQKIVEIKEVLNQIRSSGLNILIRGETGTGKNVLAKIIHNICKGEQEPFIRVNCPSIPETLFEAELFGHEKGAYTDAKSSSPGYFRLAAEGTVLLDEVSEIAGHLQAKLLRVIEDKKFMPVGGKKLIPVRANIIATTNLDLEKAVDEGRFRRDLFFRLCELPLHIPPLRERLEDVELLAKHFLIYYCSQFRRPYRLLSCEELRALECYDWPGNVRELENYMKQTALLGKFAGPPNGVAPSTDQASQLLNAIGLTDGIFSGKNNLTEMTKKLTAQIEYALIKNALSVCDQNKTRAARHLKISYRTLLRKLEQHN